MLNNKSDVMRDSDPYYVSLSHHTPYNASLPLMRFPSNHVYYYMQAQMLLHTQHPAAEENKHDSHCEAVSDIFMALCEVDMQLEVSKLQAA